MVSTTYITCMSFFCSPSLFPAFSIQESLGFHDSGIDSAILILLPMFLLGLLAIIYYFKLYKHVQQKVTEEMVMKLHTTKHIIEEHDLAL